MKFGIWKTITIFIKPRIDRRLMEVIVISCHLLIDLIFEKLHHKFCKAVLGIKKTSCNISAKSKLGRLPLDSFISTQVMLYYSRI